MRGHSLWAEFVGGPRDGETVVVSGYLPLPAVVRPDAGSWRYELSETYVHGGELCRVTYVWKAAR